MARLFSRCLSLAALALMVSTSYAQCHNCQSSCNSCNGTWNRPLTENSSPDVFYNFYQPGNGGVPAAALPAPYPTPPLVGHQYTTYQPFMPNEWLYMHHRTYHQAYNQGMGLNRTKVWWTGTPIRTDLHTIRNWFRIPR